MKSIIKKSLQGLLLIPALALGAISVAPIIDTPATYAAKCDPSKGLAEGADCLQGEDQPSDLFGNDSIFTKVINVLLFIIGAVAVVMIVIGGFKYVTSGGDSSGVTSAKNTILYAVIGLVVAFLGYAIVNFVLTNILDL